MNKFLFKSNESDLSKILSIIENMQKNIVYITYKVDNIIKVVKSIENTGSLQKQVDEFFDDSENIPEETHEDGHKDLD